MTLESNPVRPLLLLCVSTKESRLLCGGIFVELQRDHLSERRVVVLFRVHTVLLYMYIYISVSHLLSYICDLRFLVQ